MRRALSSWRLPEGPPSKMFLAWVECPGCKLEVALRRKVHTVSEIGDVNPSMVCPHCPYHEWVTLVGWRP